MNEKQKFDDIYFAFIKYLDTYFVERNLEETCKMFSPRISGFGTGTISQEFKA